MPVWRNNRFYGKSNVACSCGRCYDNAKAFRRNTSVLTLLIVSTLVLRLKAAEYFLENSQCALHLRIQQRETAEKSGLRDEKRADFIRNWRRSG